MHCMHKNLATNSCCKGFPRKNSDSYIQEYTHNVKHHANWSYVASYEESTILLKAFQVY